MSNFFVLLCLCSLSHQSLFCSARPEIIYRDQLRQLTDMGFTDAQANINALVATGGNLQASIDRLLQGQ